MLKKKILIVEDHENLMQLQSILLSAHGYEVKGAKDGAAAAASAFPHRFLELIGQRSVDTLKFVVPRAKFAPTRLGALQRLLDQHHPVGGDVGRILGSDVKVTGIDARTATDTDVGIVLQRAVDAPANSFNETV